ncbi:MAG: phosphoribosylglycinamide formyltransferase [Tissierellia bacterium]|nr:phosphoribosylglycinamide formyltransferase [Tissierellia bacterium]
MRRDLKNIAVLISGGGTNLQSLIDAIESGNINGKISIIISNRKDAYGLTRGENHNIKSIYLSGIGISQEEYDEKLLEILEKEEVDLVVLAGFLKILGSKFIQAYENKIINIHPSLIPSFCGDGFYGLKVHEKALEYGVKVSGATTHFVNEVADAGPIIMQGCVEVLDNDTPEDLQKRILKIEHSILVESVKLFCDDKLEVIGRKVFRGE